MKSNSGAKMIMGMLDKLSEGKISESFVKKMMLISILMTLVYAVLNVFYGSSFLVGAVLPRVHATTLMILFLAFKR